MGGTQQPPGRRAGLVGACAGAALLAVCLVGLVGLAVVNNRAAGLPFGGLTARVCAGVTPTPKVRLGVSWALPISSYLPALMLSPWKVCADLPADWVRPLLPSIAGEWLFPP